MYPVPSWLSLLLGEAQIGVARLMARIDMIAPVFMVVFIVFSGWCFQTGCPAWIELLARALDNRLWE